MIPLPSRTAIAGVLPPGLIPHRMALIALLIAVWFVIVARRRRIQAQPGWRPLAWGAGIGFILAIALLLIDLEAQKLATRLATPLSVAWLVLFGPAIEQVRNRRWWPGGLLAGSWLLLTLGGNAWVGSWLLGTLERSVPPAAASRWDAVAVLGGGTELTADGAPQLGSAGDRLRVGHALFRDGRTPLLVATGSSMLEARDLAAETGQLWESWGVPPPGMLLIRGPVNTSQEIQRLAEEARARGWKRIGLVSSAWHLPRAMALARRFGLAADPIPADCRGRPAPASPVFLIPCGRGFHEVQLWCSEVLGRLVGR
jgi:uncharacterized SAM-binding protein YcdF (DUF218 family)